jgi:hypothetical protein
MRSAAALIALALALAVPHRAAAFCGFYVAGGDQKMFNDATQVVVMRMGTRTVLAMQSSYKGPPEAFAMVVPVPVVLRDGDVKTLTRELFERVEQLGAPRLVEYWEQDPCTAIEVERGTSVRARISPHAAARSAAGELGVAIEAKFVVGEYQIAILSAKDSTGLEAWLTEQNYRIPEGTAPLLRPYVESGSKFFVARVDPQKVAFDTDGRAALSPLRFHYDSEDFALPIRLGLAASSGTQDLIVNILAPGQRYEVANYKNVTIPTNIEVSAAVKDRFAAFYTALFDRTIESNPGAVVTEYAWQATSCDPCPGPALNPGDLFALGAGVLDGPHDKPAPYGGHDLVLTRLHARYGKAISDDLRFRAAAPIAGGREVVRGGQGNLEDGARPAPHNNFQGRYTIRHPWTGPIRCEHPRRKIWGGPPPEIASQPGFRPPETRPAVGLAFAARGQIQLAQLVRRDIPELGIAIGASAARPPPPPPPATGSGSSTAPPDRTAGQHRSGCGCATASDRRGALWSLAILAAGAVVVRRRRGARR